MDDVSLSPDRQALGEARATALDRLYGEVCKAHAAITDFRGKLLALVPTLSGAAFALIIGTRKGFDPRFLLPVGFLAWLSLLASSATSCKEAYSKLILKKYSPTAAL